MEILYLIINILNVSMKKQSLQIFISIQKTKIMKKCFSCAICNFFGNDQVNNCTKCDEIFYTKDREVENSSNCVMKCKYYIRDSSIRQCVQECPNEYNLFIPEINKCIDDCKKDNKYENKLSTV